MFAKFFDFHRTSFCAYYDKEHANKISTDYLFDLNEYVILNNMRGPNQDVVHDDDFFLLAEAVLPQKLMRISTLPISLFREKFSSNKLA